MQALITLCFLPMVFLFSDIRPIVSIQPIYEELSGKSTLVLLDVGGTLLVHKDAVLHKEHEVWKELWFKEHYPNLSEEEKKALHLVVKQNFDAWALIEPWPDFIKQAENQNIPTVVFSKIQMDPETSRLHQDRLKHFGLLFKDSLNELQSSYELFTYNEGVIRTGAPLKGPVLKEMLQHIKHLPNKIIFVDNLLDQLKSVEACCNSLGIEFIGFHYIADQKAPPLDEDVANFQLETLVKEHRWVPTSL